MMKEQDAEDASEDTSKLAETSNKNGKKTNGESGHDNAGYEADDRTVMNEIPPTTETKNGVELVNMNVTSGKTNGSDFTHYYMPVNTHKKLLRGEKLYVTRDPRTRGVSRRKVLVCAVIWFLIVVVFVLAVLAAMGILFTSSDNEVSTQSNNKSTFLTLGTDVPTVVVNPEDSTFNGVASAQTMLLKFTITNLLFDERLRDVNSKHFESLQSRLENELYRVFSPLDIWKVTVNQFSEGSVIVNSFLFWSPEHPAKVSSQELSDHFVDVLKQSDSFLGIHKVSLSSISITGNNTEASLGHDEESQDVTMTRESRPSEFGRGMSGDWSTGTPPSTTDLWSILAGWTTEKVLTTPEEEEAVFSTLHLHQFETEAETTTVADETIVDDLETTQGFVHDTETTTMETTTLTDTTTVETTTLTDTTTVETTTAASSTTVTNTTVVTEDVTDGMHFETNVSSQEPFVTNATTLETTSTTIFEFESTNGTTESSVFLETASIVSVLHDNVTDGNDNKTDYIFPLFITTEDEVNVTWNQTEIPDLVFPTYVSKEDVANATTNQTDSPTLGTDFVIHPFITGEDLANATTNKTDSPVDSTDFVIPPFVTMEDRTNTTTNQTDSSVGTDFIFPAFVTTEDVNVTTNHTDSPTASTDFVSPPFFTMENVTNSTLNETSFHESSTPVLNHNITIDNVTATEMFSTGLFTPREFGNETEMEHNQTSMLFNFTGFEDNSTASTTVSDIVDIIQRYTTSDLNKTTTGSDVTLKDFVTTNFAHETTSDNNTTETSTQFDAANRTNIFGDDDTNSPKTTDNDNKSTSNATIFPETTMTTIIEEVTSVIKKETTSNSDINNNQTEITTSPPSSDEVDYASKNNIFEEEKSTSVKNKTVVELTTMHEVSTTTQNLFGEVDYVNKDSEETELTTTTTIKNNESLIEAVTMHNNEVTDTTIMPNKEIVTEITTMNSKETITESTSMHSTEIVKETTAPHSTEMNTTHNNETVGDFTSLSAANTTMQSVTTGLTNDYVTISSTTDVGGVEEGAGEVTYSSNEKRRRR